jgi:uncharacterized protein (DUF433 family)
MKPKIINRGRGPELEGTRITVYDVWDYAKHNDHHTYIAAILGISSDEVLTALDYIEQHKAEVVAEYKKILDRHAQGNPPEIEALRKQSHRNLLALKKQLNAQKRRGTSNGRPSRRR